MNDPQPDWATRLRPAVAARRYYAADEYLDRLLAADPRPKVSQLRALARRLLDAADEDDAAAKKAEKTKKAEKAKKTERAVRP